MMLLLAVHAFHSFITDLEPVPDLTVGCRNPFLESHMTARCLGFLPNRAHGGRPSSQLHLPCATLNSLW